MLTEFEAVLAKLDKVKLMLNGWHSAICPCHDDQHKSLNLRLDDNGKIQLKCHARCEYRDIAKAVGLSWHNNSNSNNANTEPQIVALYDYADTRGKLLYQVVRYEPKAFKQRRPDGKGGWIWNLEGIRPTLYRIQSLILGIKAGVWVFVVEGEKDVETLSTEGQTATTISGGAGARWPAECLLLFRGAKVCILPDQDEAGRKYGHYLANALRMVTEWVKVVNVPFGKDVSDYLASPFSTATALPFLVEKAPWYIPEGVVTMDIFTTYTGLVNYVLNKNIALKRRPKRVQEWE